MLQMHRRAHAASTAVGPAGLDKDFRTLQLGTFPLWLPCPPWKVPMSRRFPARLAGLALLLLAPTEALAYYPCNGPGPGEVLVGVDPGGNGVASTPLCDYVGEESGGYADTGGYWVDQYATLVWGTDANGAPASTRWASARTGAKLNFDGTMPIPAC